MNLNRRNFLFGSAAATALAGCSTAKVGVRTLKAGEKATVAIIGYGLRARDLTGEFLGLNDKCRIVAVAASNRSGRRSAPRAGDAPISAMSSKTR